MGKADQNQAKQAARAQTDSNNAQGGAIGGQLNSILGTAQSTAGSLQPQVTNHYEDIFSSGGYNPAILGDIRDNYRNFASTGGISDVDATAIRNRAADTASSTYKVAADQAQRTASATGGYGDVSAAVSADLARKGSQAASTAVTGADASIVGMRQAGKEFGVAGLGQTEQNIASNKLAATAGLTNVYGLNEAQVSATVDSIIKNYQTTGTLNNQDLTILTNLANQPGVFDKIVGTIGTLGGAAAGVMSGVGVMNHGPTPSDIRIKDVVQVLIPGKIPLIAFKYKDSKKYSPGIKIGVIAQDVENYYPELVHEIDGIKHVDYAGLSQKGISVCLK
jgi:hypothetical protein